MSGSIRSPMRRRDSVSASELAQMSVCEQLVQFEHLYGRRRPAGQLADMERDDREHRRFFQEGPLNRRDVASSPRWSTAMAGGRSAQVVPRPSAAGPTMLGRCLILAYAGHLFHAPGPPMITVKVDRVYHRRDGRLVLVELKTRRVDRTYLSDVIELSAQRVAITGETGEHVLAHAYVVVQRPTGIRTTHKVKLLGAGEVGELTRRREAILAGIVRPRLACAPALCECCAFEKFRLHCQGSRGVARPKPRPCPMV